MTTSPPKTSGPCCHGNQFLLSKYWFPLPFINCPLVEVELGPDFEVMKGKRLLNFRVRFFKKIQDWIL